ncbi:MAG: hypothetical protein HY906_23095 [Deltaproteobacteria bacterium]|nr:hypothetical protein [Deltaproteobacteria bacterium]
MNVVGCVLGTAGQSDTYEQAWPDPGNTDQKTIWRLGYGGPGGAGDPGPQATLLRHGNYDYVTNSTIWDPTIAVQTLPTSLYLADRPAWWGTMPWPAIGPDVAGLSHPIPAQVCYENGPKLGLPFDPVSCYYEGPHGTDGGLYDDGSVPIGDGGPTADAPAGDAPGGDGGHHDLGGSGCGCAATGDGPGGVLLLLLGAGLALARRRGERLTSVAARSRGCRRRS